MSEMQGKLFDMEHAREQRELRSFPPEVLQLGDRLHDAGLHEEAGNVLDMYRDYRNSIEYYESLLVPCNNPDLA